MLNAAKARPSYARRRDKSIFFRRACYASKSNVSLPVRIARRGLNFLLILSLYNVDSRQDVSPRRRWLRLKIGGPCCVN